MRYKRWKKLRKYCAGICCAALLGMTACSGTQAMNGAWWDCTENPFLAGCVDTMGGEGSGNGSGSTG